MLKHTLINIVTTLFLTILTCQSSYANTQTTEKNNNRTQVIEPLPSTDNAASPITKKTDYNNKRYKLAIKLLSNAATRTKAIDILEDLADDNHGESQYQLGLIELENKEYEDALELFIQARKNKHEESNYYIGKLYAEQLNNEKNSHILARKALQQALKTQINQQQIADTNYLLGMMYLNGYGVTKDIDKAVKILALAADNKHLKACMELGNIFTNITYQPYEAFKYFQIAALQDNKVAQYQIANHLELGKGTDKNIPEAIKWYTESAQAQYAPAQHKLANLLIADKSDISNINKAIEWYKQAVAKRYYASYFELAKVYLNEDIKTKIVTDDYIFALIKTAAENDITKAYYPLAQLYSSGRGTKKDDQEAFRYYKKAANKKNIEAQYKVGEALIRGTGVAVDFAKAAKILKSTADSSHKKAQYLYGRLLEQGRGVKKDLRKALKYYLFAAKQGLAPAQYRLARLYEIDSKIDNLTSNPVFAAYWYEKAAEQNVAEAQLNIAKLYVEGVGIRRDYVQAAKWFLSAAESGIAVAQQAIAFMYKAGTGVETNMYRAADWFEKAANQNLAKSQYEIALIYDKGLGKRNSQIKAAKWYLKAAENGITDAQYEIGKRYLQGKGIQPSIERSTYWLKIATSQEE